MAKDAFANESDLDQTLDTTGTTADDLSSGGVVTEECKAHLSVINVKKEKKEGKVPQLVFDLQVLASDKERQKNKFVFHRINLGKGNYTPEGALIDVGPLSEGSLKILLRFALGLGLISESDIGKPDLRIPWSQAAGKQCMSELRHGQDYDDKKTGEKKKGSVGIQFGEVYPLTDERVKDWPKDSEAASPTNLSDF